jgi:hypothetical protein
MVNTYGFPPTEGDLNEIRCVVGGIFVYIGDDALDSVFNIIALPHKYQNGVQTGLLAPRSCACIHNSSTRSLVHTMILF